MWGTLSNLTANLKEFTQDVLEEDENDENDESDEVEEKVKPSKDGKTSFQGMEEQINSLSELVRAQSKQVAQLHQEKDQLSKELSKIVQSKDSTISELTKKLLQLQEKNDNTNPDAESEPAPPHEHPSEDNSSSVSFYQAEITRLQEKVKNYQTQESLWKEQVEINSKLNQEKLELENKRSQLSIQLETANKESKTTTIKESVEDRVEETTKYKTLVVEFDKSQLQNKELKEQNEKLNKTLERLKLHLIELEDSHTQEGINKEDQLNLLKQRVNLLQLKESELLEKVKDFEAVKSQLFEKEQENSRLNMALNNLQNVLEQLQADEEAQIQSEILLLKKDLKTMKEERDKYCKEVSELQTVSVRCKDAEQSVRDLQQELSTKTRLIIKLQEEVEPLRKGLDETLRRLTTLAKNEENLVDKRLISKLILTYFEGKTNKKEIMEVIARILNFNEEEKRRVGIKSSGWGLLSGSANKTATTSEDKDSTLTDMWVEFLLKEVESDNQQKKR